MSSSHRHTLQVFFDALNTLNWANVEQLLSSDFHLRMLPASTGHPEKNKEEYGVWLGPIFENLENTPVTVLSAASCLHFGTN